MNTDTTLSETIEFIDLDKVFELKEEEKFVEFKIPRKPSPENSLNIFATNNTSSLFVSYFFDSPIIIPLEYETDEEKQAGELDKE